MRISILLIPLFREGGSVVSYCAQVPSTKQNLFEPEPTTYSNLGDRINTSPPRARCASTGDHEFPSPSPTPTPFDSFPLVCYSPRE
jgi:hypothetical protein